MVPEEVNIAGQMVRIEFEDGAVRSADHPDDELVGICEMDQQRIRISRTLKGDAVRTTVLHECIHGIGDTLLYSWSEKQVQQIEVAMFLLMKSNPELVQWLFGGNNGSTPSIPGQDR